MIATGDSHEDVEEIQPSDVTNPSNTVAAEIQDISLDALFSEDDSEVLVEEDSDSDGYLSDVSMVIIYCLIIC